MSPAPGPSSSIGDVAFNPVPPQASTSLDAASSSSTVTNSRQEATEPQMNGPKTCLYCGRHIETNESAQVDEAAINAATPSPSSVAFVADSSSANRLSSLLNASISIPPESISLDEDGHQICSACVARGATISNEASETLDGVVQRSGLQERRRRSLNLRQDAQVAENAEDTAMIVDRASTQSEAPGRQSRSPSSSSTNRARDGTPWRRAPWARTSVDNNASTTPLSLSLSNIGTGGDSQMITNEDDFPPLARSPNAGQSIVQASRLPVSPTRARGVASPPTSPTVMSRHPSFSRTQSGTIIAPIPNSPIVNFPSRGRNRAGSGSSSSSLNLVGAITSPSGPQGRKPSIQRRLSRSNSSQGVKTAALMEASGINIESEKIEEELFGPSSMTRPRLSTMTLPQLTSTSASKTILTDVYDRKSSRKDIHNGDEGEEDMNLVWFRYDRPDPRRDISKLRCTSRGRGCLFPGAIFNGTQKSGRMSYDVTVQIVNVDMASSHLCGYLNIRGLTDDWPELTTYFDAEIIGQKYGFITSKWGATEADDMKHWSRFAPFRPIKNSLTKPGLRFNHMNKPFIFMRWKERFLVPDHRVRDINGASFAGFYYVCVELGEEDNTNVPIISTPLSPSLSSTTATTATAAPSAISVGSSVTYTATPPPTFTRQRSVSNRRRVASANAAQSYPLEVSHWPRGGEEDQTIEGAIDSTQSSTTAMPSTDEAVPMSLTASTLNQAAITGRMSGFYFHEHSEPYQQLTLQHVAERSSSTFELR